MKKLLFLLSMFAMLVVSCAKDDATILAENGEGNMEVSFKVKSPGMQTRYGEGTTANKLFYAVYHKGKLMESISALTLEKAVDIYLSTDVKMVLANGATYDILFWAQAEDAPYTFDGAKVTIDYDALKANEEKYDAFFRSYSLTVNGTQPHSVELRRPFAQLNVGTADTEEAKMAGMVVEQTSITVEACTVLDLATGVASEPQEITFELNDKADDKYNGYDIITMNYLLVNSDKELIDVKFKAEGSENVIESEYFNIPIQRNYRTYIVGNILTSLTDFEVWINPIFEDWYIENPDWVIYYTSTDGKIVEPYSIVCGANIIDNTYANGRGKITFDGPVTEIGSAAFYNCNNLTNIHIPDSVTAMGDSVFRGCSSLTSIHIPDGVTEIGFCAFFDCFSLTSIHIPESVMNIGMYAFEGCSNLTSINIPDSVTSIGYGAFNGCSNLISINIPSSAIKIEGCAFNGCSNLTSIRIPDGVTEIGDWTFCNCSNLTNMHIPDSVISIGYSAFGDCTSLTSLTIPDSVTEIGEYVFYYCTGLTSITIPSSVTKLGYMAFYMCDNLKEVYCTPTTPPTAECQAYLVWSAFDYNAADRKIYVPTESVEAYKTAEGWSEYADNIEGYDF